MVDLLVMHISDICKILEKYLRIKPRMLLSITYEFQKNYLPILPKMLKYKKLEVQIPYFDNL